MGERMGDNCPQENNNNQEEQKTATQKPSSWRPITRTSSQQLLLHRVPILFPVPGNLLESEDSLRFIFEALGSLVEARSAVILTFDTTDRRDRVWRAARAVKPNANFSGRTEYYFTEIAKRTKMCRQQHSEEEHQGVENDSKNTQEERRAAKSKKRSKEKSQAITQANKLKNKYSALDEYAEKLKKRGATLTAAPAKG